ncbi:MAG TPA: alpha/beta fold hydrolase [Candidatus Obscuribacter sp.]|nr:alpha/beta fold hydrolase [Candidatus Obscuribacter sp.]HMY51946.1 alpha/beta fold hydrolase [Candidatus Obscuribacter sp.]HNB17242.1 alpha/beta fold hydrolase [Candidatus Obscuribacter sp.]HND68410.1 alpha/beta fold hydrolase [Candidatus Obscuribacter sp.]HNG20421.1 alpha/beta fold hydrolase [Candidatus Obscuribacter sp.]
MTLDKTKRSRLLITYKQLNVLIVTIGLSLYLAFCPCINEPLYQACSVHPCRVEMNLLEPPFMEGFKGEHRFFPVINCQGRSLSLHGVYFRSNSSATYSKHNGKSKGTVIFSLGNSSCLAYMLGTKPMVTLLKLGYDIFAYDYEGFGISQGEANYRKLGNDGLSAFEYVSTKINPENIILYGLSMGTGVSSYIAERKPVKAVILDSPYVTPEKTIKLWFPILSIYPSWMFPEPKYDNARFVSARHPPVLVITKGCDEVTLPTQGLELSKVASQPASTLYLKNSHHCYVSDEEEPLYTSRLKTFLAAL